MAEDTKSQATPPTTDAAQPQAPVGGIPHDGGIVAAAGAGLPAGADAAGDAVTASSPAGGIALDAGANVVKKLDDAAPAFGAVLSAIGGAVASSQKALDKGVIEAVDTLSKTKIDVVTQVVQELDDDGNVDASKTKLVTNKLSVLNFFTPTYLEWKNVSVSMDLSVSEFHQEQGVKFHAQQERTNVSGGGTFWPFTGWFHFDRSSSQQNAQSQSQTDLTWSSGQVQVDAQLGPRRTSKFPVPAEATKGPQIFVTQGAVAEKKTGDTVTGRSVDVLIELHKKSGEPMQQGVSVVVDSGGLLPSFPGGSSTDINGKVRLTVTRSVAGGGSAFQKFPLSVALGTLRKPFTVTL